MQWTSEADAKLFAYVLKVHSIKIEYAALAQAMGNDCTPKAIMHRIAKLKEVAKGDEEGIPLAGTASATSTPKRGPRAKATPGSTPMSNKSANGSALSTATKRSASGKAITNSAKKGTAPAGAGTSDDEEDEDDGETNDGKAQPASNGKKAAVKAKAEAGGHEGGTPSKKPKLANETPKRNNNNNNKSTAGNTPHGLSQRLLAATEQEIINGRFDNGDPLDAFTPV